MTYLDLQSPQRRLWRQFYQSDQTDQLHQLVQTVRCYPWHQLFRHQGYPADLMQQSTINMQFSTITISVLMLLLVQRRK